MVSHILNDKEEFLKFMSSRFERIGIVAKKTSIDHDSMKIFKRYADILPTTKEDLASRFDISSIVEFVGHSRRLLIIDVGGYFSSVIPHLMAAFGERLIGIVEDTANGEARYQAATCQCPVISIGRAKLKEPEDIRVGHSIVFSIETIMREYGIVPHEYSHLVIGFGRVGRSIAVTLARRQVRVIVYDRDPLKLAKANALGLETRDRDAAMTTSDVIIGATGAKSLTTTDLSILRPGSLIASATSPDDEFDFFDVSKQWTESIVGSNVTMLRNKTNSSFLYLLNHGRTINFLHKAVIGSPIYLVQGGIILAISILLNKKNTFSGILFLNHEDQKRVAAHWYDAFCRKR